MKVRETLALLMKLNWAAILAMLLVVAGVTMALCHRSDVAIAMVIGSLTFAHLAHLADKEPPRA